MGKVRLLLITKYVNNEEEFIVCVMLTTVLTSNWHVSDERTKIKQAKLALDS